jgi:hypothetical protein
MKKTKRTKFYLLPKVFLAIAVFVFVSCFGFIGQKTQADNGTWDRLTDLPQADTQIPRIVEFNGKLYAMVTSNGTNNADPEVWVSDTNGENWAKSDAFSAALGAGFDGIFHTEMAVFNNKLYVVISPTMGAFAVVLTTDNGTTWSATAPDDLEALLDGGDNTLGITNLQVFGDNLYIFCNGSDGLTVIKVDTSSHYTVAAASSTFGANAMYSLTSQIYLDKMYIGVSNFLDGAEAWFTPDGTTWLKTTGNIPSPENNTIVQSSFVTNNELFLVTVNLIGDPIVHVFKSSNGANWADVSQSGLPNSGVSLGSLYGSQTAIAGGKVYLPISDGTLGAEIYSSSDGASWTLEPAYTPDPDNNFLQSESVVLFNNHLYASIDRMAPVGFAKRNFLQTDRAYAAGDMASEGAFIMRSPEIYSTATPAPTPPTPTPTTTPSLTLLPKTGIGE